MWRIGLLSVACLTSMASAAVADERIADAVRRGDTGAVRVLLAQKADVNGSSGDGTTALHWAAYMDDVDAAKLLLAAGANVRAVTRNGAITPLMLAATQGSEGVVRLLLTAGADPEVRTTDGATPLMTAAASGSVEAVRLLLDHGADVNAKDVARGQTPLMYAAAADRVAVIEVLLQRHADPAITSRLIQFEPPRRAAQPRPGAVADGLAEARAKRRARATATGGMTALHFAARDGRLDAVRALVKGGGDIEQLSESDHSSALITAICSGHYELALFLIDHGANVNGANDDGLTPLYATIEKQFAPVSWSPTRLTTQEGVTYMELMKVLLDRGADPNLPLKRKLWFRPSDHDDSWIGTAETTPFWRAAFAADVEAMRLLLAYGANPQIPSFEGVTPLMAAAGLGWTANFHRTVPDGWLAAVKLCLELGADLSARDMFGYTALHGAAYRGDNDLVRFLAGRGARLDPETIFGANVADMANGFVAYDSLPRSHPATVQLLLELGAPAPHPERTGEHAFCAASTLNCPQVSSLR